MIFYVYTEKENYLYSLEADCIQSVKKMLGNTLSENDIITTIAPNKQNKLPKSFYSNLKDHITQKALGQTIFHKKYLDYSFSFFYVIDMFIEVLAKLKLTDEQLQILKSELKIGE